ncbi:hypothetical protein pb186bvf_001999 [Paramecium bursaria]
MDVYAAFQSFGFWYIVPLQQYYLLEQDNQVHLVTPIQIIGNNNIFQNDSCIFPKQRNKIAYQFLGYIGISTTLVNNDVKFIRKFQLSTSLYYLAPSCQLRRTYLVCSNNALELKSIILWIAINEHSRNERSRSQLRKFYDCYIYCLFKQQLQSLQTVQKVHQYSENFMDINKNKM